MSKWKEDELTNLLKVLDNAVNTGQGLIRALGGQVGRKHIKDDDEEMRKLDLDYDSEKEEGTVGDSVVADDPPSILDRPKTTIRPEEAKLKEKRREQKIKEIRERKRKILNAQKKADPNEIHLILRSDFPKLISILVDLMDDKMTVNEMFKSLRRDKIKKIIRKRIEKSKITICAIDKEPEDCMIDLYEKILLNTEKYFFSQKELCLEQLTNRDKAIILKTMYEETPERGLACAPLKIFREDIIKVTKRYTTEKYPNWDVESFTRRLEGNQLL